MSEDRKEQRRGIRRLQADRANIADADARQARQEQTQAVNRSRAGLKNLQDEQNRRAAESAPQRPPGGVAYRKKITVQNASTSKQARDRVMQKRYA